MWTQSLVLVVLWFLVQKIESQYWAGGGYVGKPFNYNGYDYKERPIPIVPPQWIGPPALFPFPQTIIGPLPPQLPPLPPPQPSINYHHQRPPPFEPYFASLPNGVYPGSVIRASYACFGAYALRVVCSDGRRPEMVLRWRRQGYRCDSYLYAYCGNMDQVKDGVVIYEEDCYQNCFTDDERPMVPFYKGIAIERPMA